MSDLLYLARRLPLKFISAMIVAFFMIYQVRKVTGCIQCINFKLQT